MDTFPPATSFEWTFNSSRSKAGAPFEKVDADKFRQFNGSVSGLIYSAETEKDFGELRCFAANSLGVSSKPCVFKLVAAGKLSLEVFL